jgi:hypothetical protein
MGGGDADSGFVEDAIDTELRFNQIDERVALRG